MTKKKLIIFMPSIENGGVEKNLFLIANFLSKHLKNIILITSNNKYSKNFRNIKIITPKLTLESFKGRKIKYFFCIIELIKLLLKKEKYVLFAFQANLYCALVGLFFPKLKIITRSNSSPSGWSKNFIKKKIFLFLFKRINKVIVNSIDFQKELNKKFKIKSVCIYNPLNKQFILNKSKEHVSLNFFKKGYLNIINIGRLVDQKDQITFLRALNILKNKIKYKALILGSGEKLSELSNYIKRNSLNKNIKIINFQKNPFKYIKKADVIIHTAKFEGLPNVLLEGLCLKKYIISTDCPTGPSEILSNGKGGDLVKVGDYNAISRKILNLNKKKMKKKITYAYSKLERFDFLRSQKKYLEIINKYIF